MVAEIIGIDPVQHLRTLSGTGEGGQVPVQFPLAGVAAVDGIAAVGGVKKFLGLNLLVTDSQPDSLQPGFLQQMRRQSGGDPRDGCRPAPQLFLGDGGHQSTVHPTRVGDTGPAIAANDGTQPIEFLMLKLTEGLEQTEDPAFPFGVGLHQANVAHG